MSVPNLKEIDWAISELENQESSDTGYVLLAALYTCRNELTGLSAHIESAKPVYAETQPLKQYGQSKFLEAVAGKDPVAAWGVIDDLMETLRVVNPRVYNSVMRKIHNL